MIVLEMLWLGMQFKEMFGEKKLMKDHENLRIKEVKDEDCWWNFGTD